MKCAYATFSLFPKQIELKLHVEHAINAILVNRHMKKKKQVNEQLFGVGYSKLRHLHIVQHVHPLAQRHPSSVFFVGGTTRRPSGGSSELSKESRRDKGVRSVGYCVGGDSTGPNMSLSAQGVDARPALVVQCGCGAGVSLP